VIPAIKYAPGVAAPLPRTIATGTAPVIPTSGADAATTKKTMLKTPSFPLPSEFPERAITFPLTPCHNRSDTNDFRIVSSYKSLMSSTYSDLCDILQKSGKEN
jgi:hypothetical protein